MDFMTAQYAMNACSLVIFITLIVMFFCLRYRLNMLEDEVEVWKKKYLRQNQELMQYAHENRVQKYYNRERRM